MMVFDSSFSSLNATVFPEFQGRYLKLMGSCYKFPAASCRCAKEEFLRDTFANDSCGQ